MTAKVTSTVADSTVAEQLRAESDITGVQIVFLIAVFGLGAYYLYRKYFGASGSKCGGCSSQSKCGVAAANLESDTRK